MKLLIRQDKSPADITREFRKWKHDDRILPTLTGQLETILYAYNKFQPVVYDTQGIRDDGVDVVLRHHNKEETADELKVIAFQAKSYNDLCNTNYLKDIKAQYSDSRKVAGLEYYFIILCTDADKHRNKVRQICAEFRSDTKVEVIEPAYAYPFLVRTESRVHARLKRNFDKRDVVLEKAFETLRLSAPGERALVVYLTSKYVTQGRSDFKLESIMQDPHLEGAYQGFKDVVQEFDFQITEDLQNLVNASFIEFDVSTGESLRLRTECVRPVAALIMDAIVRYEYDADNILPYAFSLLEIGD
ncbi:MAG TPA: hypothetical protein VMV72_05315 [Verrucomicrobiae bacterium]|nr:hypothetical protein [Verrucomicrobiae bacterium]